MLVPVLLALSGVLLACGDRDGNDTASRANSTRAAVMSSSPSVPTSSDTSGSAPAVTSAPSSWLAPSSTSTSASAPSSSPPATDQPSVDPAATLADPHAGVPLPDGFVPERLRPGQRPPQFVVVSFDGVGWHQEWQHWMDVAAQVPFRFTGFLSGTYLLSSDTRDEYHPPYFAPGTSEIGWGTPDDVRVEIGDLNRALAAGMEIGTHFNGHFCASAGLPSGGDTWTTRDWDVELDQFFHLLRDYRSDNALPPSVRLRLGPQDITGERTPCLEGRPEALYPAVAAHGFAYDSSFTRGALTWPTRDPRSHLWQIGMTTFPLHGTGHPVTTMDYNYFFTQRGGVDGTAAQARADQRQVLATYDDLYRRSLQGNRAPVILGNHFNDWNHHAYVNALTSFVLDTCGRPNTRCVPFRDLVAWLDVQRPDTLARLQR
jgi:hypothetical protein